MTKTFMLGYETLNNDDEERVYSAQDLNFRQGPVCQHSFKRISGTRVECERCGVGYIDNHDFPIDELNAYYKNHPE